MLPAVPSKWLVGRLAAFMGRPHPTATPADGDDAATLIDKGPDVVALVRVLASIIFMFELIYVGIDIWREGAASRPLGYHLAGLILPAALLRFSFQHSFASHWKMATATMCIMLVAMNALWATSASSLFTVLWLASMGCATLLPLGARWQWVINLVCLMSFAVASPRLTYKADSAYAWVGLLYAVVLSQFTARFLDRYRNRLKQLLDGTIAKRREAEDDLLSSEERTFGFIQKSPDAFVLIDEKGTVALWNPRAEEVFGWRSGEAVGRLLAELIIPTDQRAAHLRGLKRFLATGEMRVLDRRIELTALRRGGDEIPVEMTVSPFRVQDGWVFGAFIRDISDRKRMEAERSQFASIVTSASDAIVSLDLDGLVASWNQGAERLFGYTAAEIERRSIRVVYPPERMNEFAALTDRRKTASTINAETQRLRKDGTLVDVSITVSSVSSADGAPVGYSLIARDIGDRKEAERELIKARESAMQASHLKSQFLANMSHEIRTPMNAILGMHELLAETALDPEQLEYVKIAASNGEALLDLINDILDLSKVEAGALKLEETPFDLPELVHEVAATFASAARERGLRMTCKVAPDLPPRVAGDPMRLRQVLINLAGNAVKFTPNGEVTIGVVKDPSGGAEGAVRFDVADTGIGIAEDKFEAIFASFTQAESSTSRRYGGTGLGLSISRRLVEMMGGRIWLESQLGKGSTFHFTVSLKPLAEANPAFAIAEQPHLRIGDASPPATISSIRPLNILLAEDSRDSRFLIAAYLRKTPHQLEMAENGEIAFKKIISSKYDLVLMDIQMPLMDGYGCVLAIRKWEAENRRPPTLIYALSAHALKEARARSLDVGCDAHLVKPLGKETLLAAIAEAAKRPPVVAIAVREADGRATPARGAIRSTGQAPKSLAADPPPAAPRPASDR